MKHLLKKAFLILVLLSLPVIRSSAQNESMILTDASWVYNNIVKGVKLSECVFAKGALFDSDVVVSIVTVDPQYTSLIDVENNPPEAMFEIFRRNSAVVVISDPVEEDSSVQDDEKTSRSAVIYKDDDLTVCVLVKGENGSKGVTKEEFLKICQWIGAGDINIAGTGEQANMFVDGVRLVINDGLKKTSRAIAVISRKL